MTKIKIAVVGLNFGRHIIEDIVNGTAGQWVELAAVCDMDEKKAKSFSEKYSVPYFTDLTVLLADHSIPTIGLYTGPSGRAKLLDLIIDAGKDVMTTKPFELDCEAGLAVLRKAKKRGRIIHLNSPGPCLSEDLALAKQWENKYDLGMAVACQLSVWVRYNEEANGSWHDDPSKCPVAPVFRLGIYLINDLVSLFGEAEKVSVVSSRVFTGRPTADQGQLSILFKSGAIANVFASFCVEDGDHYQNGMTLNFERGTVYRNVGPQRKTIAGDMLSEMSLVMGSTHDSDARQVTESEIVSGSSGLYQWENFACATQGEDIAEATTPEDVIAGLRIIEAMKEADLGSGSAKVVSVC